MLYCSNRQCTECGFGCQSRSTPDRRTDIRSWMSSVKQSDTIVRMCVQGVRASPVHLQLQCC